MLYQAVDHPAIACYDVEGLAEWYCRYLGMRIIASNGRTPPTLLVGYGESLGNGAAIELMPATEPGPRPVTFTRFQPGIRHLALRVADFDAAYETLESLGVTFTSEIGEAL